MEREGYEVISRLEQKDKRKENSKIRLTSMNTNKGMHAPFILTAIFSILPLSLSLTFSKTFSLSLSLSLQCSLSTLRKNLLSKKKKFTVMFTFWSGAVFSSFDAIFLFLSLSLSRDFVGLLKVQFNWNGFSKLKQKLKHFSFLEIYLTPLTKILQEGLPHKTCSGPHYEAIILVLQ